MAELIELVDAALQETCFEAGSYGSLNISEIRAVRALGGQTRRFVESVAKAVIPEARLAEIADQLARDLEDYLEPETQRIGTGLISLMGGPLDQAEPTVTEFARTLVDAASVLGSERAIRVLRGWIAGEPYRFRMIMVLTGVRCLQPLALEEGVRVMQLPTTSDELDSHLPSSVLWAGRGSNDFLGRAVLAIDGTARPALHRPDPDQGDGSRRMLDEVPANGAIPCLMTDDWRLRFTEALSLACDHRVRWTHIWRYVGEARAFNRYGGDHETRDESSWGDRVDLKQEHLERARDIDIQRHTKVENGKRLDMAIRRWINSKRPRTALADRFIELRIAFEVLYLDGDGGELRFRVACHAAWHLGSDFNERQQCYELVRKAYDRGSKAVHTGHVDDTAANRRLLSDAQRACREAILKLIADTEERRPWKEVSLGAPGPEESA